MYAREEYYPVKMLLFIAYCMFVAMSLGYLHLVFNSLQLFLSLIVFFVSIILVRSVLISILGLLMVVVTPFLIPDVYSKLHAAISLETFAMFLAIAAIAGVVFTDWFE